MTTDTAKTMTRKNLFQKTTIISGLALLSLLPTLAFAHPGHGLMAADGSFGLSILSGMLHPLTGFDHLMLALGMGMLFTQMHSFKKGFVALLIGLVTGFLLSLSVSLNSLFIEYGILLSIVLLTMALMSRYFNVALNQNHEMSVKTVYKFLIIGFGALAMFHGAAHAIEVPANSNTAGFFTGMIVAMLGLYTIGKGFATYLNTHLQDSLIIQRVIAVVGLCGVLLG
ncbi:MULTISPECIES: HupE/UreJ family protein [Psychrobacter]|jgi:urease accessory protein|uniref:Urease accessory protein n=1 Tax=Psychrobacter immobilis TaxID=498 RepID=A0A2V2AA58_PSYIM|nr:MULTISPECIES: HupE/UreJ family protein [Psychrobacter]PWK14554.1 urease accessory protein [Psychrobacter immobilis]GAF62233.1 nickel-binding accessory protein UreJ-HupE [Psychrobacter sp. JCM 18903]